MLKRWFDFVVALVLIVVFLPFWILLALLVRFNMGSPIFFKQTRPGMDGMPFTLIKFRTMINSKNGLLSDAERLTRFGRFLRSTSLDEIPELWNVLTGAMSLVGPRPLLMNYLPLYTAEQFRRHSVRPGITGWAQVNGRNALSWVEKFKLDVWYVDHANFKLDLKILLLTLKKVVFREGVSAEGEATMQEFTGL